MHFEDITMTMFAACNGIRVVAYVPQIYKAFTHRNGASAVSGTTWGLFFIANVSTVAYAIVNRSDYWLAACFGLNALCCAAILLAAYWGGLSWGAARSAFDRWAQLASNKVSNKTSNTKVGCSPNCMI
jgi:PQ loop repeat